MADFDFSRRYEDEELLLIVFTGSRPISALQLADVLGAMDSDYRALTGSSLSLAHYEVGTTWVWVTDVLTSAGGLLTSAAEAAKATQDLWKFAKDIKNAFKKKDIIRGYELSAESSVGKTVEAVAKVVEATGASVRIRKSTVTNEKVESFDIEVTPADAKLARQRAKKKLKQLKDSSKKLKVEARYTSIAETMRALPPVTSDLEATISAIVRAHTANGTTSVLQNVASTLEQEGRFDIASIIRRHLGDRNGTFIVEE